MKITVQAFQNGKALGEYIANVKEANTEQEAVNIFLKYSRIDLQFRFLGMHGIVTASSPNEYRCY